MMLEATFLPRVTAAEVSSQEVSIAKISWLDMRIL